LAIVGRICCRTTCHYQRRSASSPRPDLFPARNRIRNVNACVSAIPAAIRGRISRLNRQVWPQRRLPQCSGFVAIGRKAEIPSRARNVVNDRSDTLQTSIIALRKVYSITSSARSSMDAYL
jgi:hypothetical protein